LEFIGEVAIMPRTRSNQEIKNILDRRIAQVRALIPAPGVDSYRGRVTKGQLDLAAKILGFPDGLGGLNVLLEKSPEDRDLDRENPLQRYARRLDGLENEQYSSTLKELLRGVIRAYEENKDLY